MTILITGAAGYIGSHICSALEAKSVDYFGIDNFSRGNTVVNKNNFGQLDISDHVAVSRVMIEKDIRTVIHLAAFASVQESIQSPEIYFQNNIENSSALIRNCVENGVENFIFSSSCSVYGNCLNLPITENELTCPISPYGHSKLIIENFLQSLFEAGKLNSICLRYFNAAGANSAAGLKENHNPETHFIPIAVDCGIHGRALEIFGSSLNTVDGTPERDFVHVEDIASAHINSIAFLQENSGYHQLNIGSGRGHTLLQVVNEIARQGFQIQYSLKKTRQGDPDRLFADNQLAKRLLGWVPEHSSLENIVSTTIKSRV